MIFDNFYIPKDCMAKVLQVLFCVVSAGSTGNNNEKQTLLINYRRNG